MKRIHLVIWLLASVYGHAQTAEDYFSRGEQNVTDGTYQEAIKNYTKAISLKHNYTLAYVGRGLAKLNLQDYAKAIADFDEAIYIDNKCYLAYTNRGVARSDMQNFRAAVTDF